MTDRAHVIPASHAPRSLMHELASRVRLLNIVMGRSEVGQWAGEVRRPVPSGQNFETRKVWITQREALRQSSWSADLTGPLAHFEIAA